MPENANAENLPNFLRAASYRVQLRRRVLVRTLVFALGYTFFVGFGLRHDVGLALRLAALVGAPSWAGANALAEFQRRLKRANFAVATLSLAAAYTAFLTSIFLIVIAVAPNGSRGPMRQPLQFVGMNALSIYPTFFGMMILIFFLRGVATKIGPNQFRNWLLGRYFQPRKEVRIFMFLDMRASTRLAEELGDEKFAELLREFMYELSDAVSSSKGEVSHYIGDEAVITWTPKAGFEEGRCVQCFFRFGRILEDRREEFLSKFGVVPGFKAGIHYGEVIATEVGEQKSELVYLGDVLNTTARLQAACNELKCDLVLSEEVANRLPSLSWLRLTQMPPIGLKGKAQPVAIYRGELNL